MGLFQMLHASDLHAAAESRRIGWGERSHLDDFPEAKYRRFKAASWDPDLAEILANQIIKQSLPNLNALLLTGDIATTGDLKDFNAARSKFLNLIQPGHQDPALVILPGNHDRFLSRFLIWRAYGANNSSFDKVFENEWRMNASLASKPMDSRPAVRVQILRDAGNSELAVVAADFTLCQVSDAGGSGLKEKTCNRLGRGKAYPEVLNPLIETTTTASSRDSRPVVWAIHFPPHFPHNPPCMELLDESGVLTVAARLKIRHVFCGHTHRPYQYTLKIQSGQLVTVYCAGTATQYCAPAADGGNTVHPVEVETNNGQVTAVRWYTLEWVKGQGYQALRDMATGGYVSHGRAAPFLGVPICPSSMTFDQCINVLPPSGIWPTWLP